MAKNGRSTWGEGARPRQRGDGQWVAAIDDGWTAQGKRHRRTVYGHTEQECKRKLRAAKKSVLISDAAAVNPRETVKGWCDQWIQTYAETARPDTVRDQGSLMHKWIIPTLGKRRMCDLGAADQRKLERAMRTDGTVGETTIHDTCELLRRILKAAKTDGYTVPDPIMLARLPRRATPDREAMPVSVAARVLATAASRYSWPDPPELPELPYGAVRTLSDEDRAARARIRRERDDHRLALETDPSRWVAALLQGLRSSEALGLTWDRIDWRRHTILIDRQLKPLKTDAAIPRGYEIERLDDSYVLAAPKTRSGIRLLPMVPWMEQTLGRWRDRQTTTPHNLVWPRASGSPCSKEDSLAAWRGLQRVAGVHRDDGRLYVLHEARHTSVSLLLAAGVSPQVVIAIVGHATFASTQRYEHTDLDAARQGLLDVADRLQLA